MRFSPSAWAGETPCCRRAYDSRGTSFDLRIGSRGTLCERVGPEWDLGPCDPYTAAHGQLTRACPRAVFRENARSGELQVSLIWNDIADLDLHVYAPGAAWQQMERARSACRPAAGRTSG